MDKRRLLKTAPKKESYTVVSISVVGRFSVDGSGKHVEKYAFSYDDGLVVWTGENKTKTLVWSRIFFFVFVKAKTNSFKNA